MKYDFDQIIDRTGTNCLKYDFAKERGRSPELLPMWVADMDFQTAPCIMERLKEVVCHGIFGYSDSKEDYFKAAASWYGDHFGWKVEPQWLVKTPGVVFALAAAVRAFTKEGEGVLLQQPVYYPFREVIQDNGRVVVNSPLVERDGRYEMDLGDLEQKIREEHVKLYLLCSPHNPVGRVWTKEELEQVGEICLRHGVVIVSDEIHSDFVWQGHTHHVMASLSEELAKITITCTAPSKTFNLAGLQISNIWISNPELRRRFQKEIAAAGYSQVNVMGLAACQAAYEGGYGWLCQLREYLWENLRFTRQFLEKEIPQVRLIEPEGTYLLWLDFRKLGLTEEQHQELIVDHAKLWLDSGAIFGKDGEGFERINMACPRSVLRQALEQLAEAVRRFAADPLCGVEEGLKREDGSR